MSVFHSFVFNCARFFLLQVGISPALVFQRLGLTVVVEVVLAGPL